MSVKGASTARSPASHPTALRGTGATVPPRHKTLFAMALLSLSWATEGEAAGTAADLVPRYDHIIVIVEENQS
jgi:hypothetical protein